MNNFQSIIGIEVHAVVNSKTKMFSGTTSSHNAPVNTNINEIDLALPGSMPSVNQEVIKKALCLATALHMNIAETISFDRKNYFYRDLPKGFQITQQFNPIGTDGYVEIVVDGQKKKIHIERIHMEEDTAKQVLVDGKVLLDYNRCGMPLIEIVSKPDISSADEAMAYLSQLKRILTFSGNISDAKMEDGSLRADINISVNLHGAKQYGTRVEIKNLNSISNVGKAINFEIKRQISLLLIGKNVEPETRRFDDIKNETVYMRNKEAVDYHFIPEGNILPFPVSNEIKQQAKELLGRSIEEIRKNLIELKIHEKLIDQLLDDYPLYKVFSKVLSQTKNVEMTITWIMIELVGLLRKDNKTIKSIGDDKIDNIIKMVNILISGRINSKQAKIVISEIYKSNEDPEIIIKRFGFKQITNANEIEKLLTTIINNNLAIVLKNKDRPERVEKMLIGQLMKETQGQANPIISANVVKLLLENLNK